MNNSEIICSEAIASGFYTAEEVDELISEGLLPEMHTFAIWKSQFGMVPRAGQHGWPCRLWLKRQKKNESDEQDNSEEKKGDFYLAKSYLFHVSQVETINKEREAKRHQA